MGENKVFDVLSIYVYYWWLGQVMRTSDLFYILHRDPYLVIFGPLMNLVEIPTLMLRPEIGIWFSIVVNPYACNDAHVCCAHKALTNHLDAVICPEVSVPTSDVRDSVIPLD